MKFCTFSMSTESFVQLIWIHHPVCWTLVLISFPTRSMSRFFTYFALLQTMCLLWGHRKVQCISDLTFRVDSHIPAVTITSMILCVNYCLTSSAYNKMVFLEPPPQISSFLCCQFFPFYHTPKHKPTAFLEPMWALPREFKRGCSSEIYVYCCSSFLIRLCCNHFSFHSSISFTCFLLIPKFQFLLFLFYTCNILWQN